MEKEYRLYLNDTGKAIGNFDSLDKAQKYGKSIVKDFYILDEQERNVTFGFTVKSLIDLLSKYDGSMEVRIGFENPNSSNLVVYEGEDCIYLNCPVEEEFEVYEV